MAVPRKDSFRLVSDCKAVNEHVEKSPGVMPKQEADMVDLLSARFFGKSRWVSFPALPVGAVAVFSLCDQDDSIPSKAVVRQAQQKALATDGTEVQSFESAVGLAVLDDELSLIHI